jgi:23S rRNA (cytosine1962-C5)-methyltransferase
MVSPAFLARRLGAAVQAREHLPGLPAASNAVRLVNAESDGIPGLIVDCYAEFLACQFLSAGPEHWKADILAALQQAVPAARGAYERSDVDVRVKEGLPQATGRLYGAEPPDHVEIAEHGARYLVDVRTGHKTGFYLDQRDNRKVTAALAKGREVLNAFAYTGAFGVATLLEGAAHCLNLDSSGAALALAEHNYRLNGLPAEAFAMEEADVFTALRRYRDARRSFDLVILDPPKFAQTGEQVGRASRAYKDINLLALKLLRPEGLLVTFSCSGAVSAGVFQQFVQAAALDSGREAQIVGRLTQAADHPVALSFPEAEYLKGLIVRVR